MRRKGPKWPTLSLRALLNVIFQIIIQFNENNTHTILTISTKYNAFPRRRVCLSESPAFRYAAKQKCGKWLALKDFILAISNPRGEQQNAFAFRGTETWYKRREKFDVGPLPKILLQAEYLTRLPGGTFASEPLAETRVQDRRSIVKRRLRLPPVSPRNARH